MAKPPTPKSVEVPTMDDLDNLQKQIDSLDERVTNLEQGNPQPVTPSPDGTQVTDTSGKLVDGAAREFTLVDDPTRPGQYQIKCEGKVTGGGVLRLYAKSQLCYQENFNHDWWYMPLDHDATGPTDPWVQTTDPTGSQPTSDAPDYAVAVGYTKRTFGPKLKLGTNCWGWTGSNEGSGLTTNNDGSIHIRGGDGNHWNAQITICSEQHKPVRPSGDGIAFGGGGYFECKMKYANPCAGWYQGAPGWPAYWGGAYEASYGQANSHGIVTNIECDFLESMTKNSADFNHGLIQWWNGVMNGAGEGGVDSRCYLPAGTRSDQYHLYGWLWVMATDTANGYAQAYFDRQPVGPRYEWVKYQPGMSQGEQGPTKYAAVDEQHLQVLFGTGPENPMDVAEFSVWQSPTNNKNLGSAPLINGDVPVTPSDTLFADEFTDNLSLWNSYAPDSSKTWQLSRWYAPDWNGWACNDGWMVNPFNPATPKSDMYRLDNGNLILDVQRTPSNMLAACGNKKILTAQINTLNFKRLGGYWEAKIKAPNIPGTNMAFWLMNNKSWPPEVDIVEIVNHGDWQLMSQNLWHTDHTTEPYYLFNNQGFVVDDWHTYGFWWDHVNKRMQYFYDGRKTIDTAEPSGYTDPMFIILGSQQGGEWSGSVPDNATLGPLRFEYVRTYAQPPTDLAQAEVTTMAAQAAPVQLSAAQMLTFHRHRAGAVA